MNDFKLPNIVLLVKNDTEKNSVFIFGSFGSLKQKMFFFE